MASLRAHLRHYARPLVHATPLRVAVFVLVAIAAGMPMLDQAGGMNTFHDAQFLSAYERHAALSVLRFGELPLWDPYSCGGMYGLAAPQTRYASPFFVLSLMFGVDPAISLLAVLMPALGMMGMFRYARSWGATRFAAFAFAPLFPLSGFFAYGYHYGWIQFYSFCLLPWILWSLRGALRGDRRAALFCALSVAVTMGFGGTYTLPMAVLPALGELGDALVPSLRTAQLREAFRRRARHVLLGLALTTSLVVGVSAYRLWPMLESVPVTLRVMGGEPKFAVEKLLSLLFSPADPEHLNRGHYYVAPVVVLALFSLRRPRTLALWLVAALAFALSLGHVAPYAPFPLLRKLPVYDTLRYPERYLLLFVLAASLLSARGASVVEAWARRCAGKLGRLALRLTLACVALVGVVLEAQNTRAHGQNVRLEPSPVFEGGTFRQSRGNRWLMSHFHAENMGSLACGEAYPVPMSKRLRGDLPAEEYLVPLAQDEAGNAPLGEVVREDISPNTIRLKVDAKRPVRLAINQNHHPGWRASTGKVESWDGLLSVVLPAGEHHVQLAFRPRSGLGGILVSFAALLGGMLFVLLPGLTRPGQILSVTIGPLLIGALHVVWPEPRWERPPAVDDLGEPLVLDQLPEGAQPIGATFALPIALEGVRLPERVDAAAGEVPIELYFRRTGKLPATLGIFVHLQGPARRTVHGDHAVLSGHFYLPRMPEGKVVRDTFRLALPRGLAGEWQVRVGLWHAYGDRSRVAVRAPGKARVQDNALFVGSFQSFAR